MRLQEPSSFTTGLELKNKNQNKQKTTPRPSNYVSQEARNICFNFRCGGKSEGIECIYKTFKKVSAPILIAPEAATIIGTSGLTLEFS